VIKKGRGKGSCPRRGGCSDVSHGEKVEHAPSMSWEDNRREKVGWRWASVGGRSRWASGCLGSKLGQARTRKQR
jgi:hypothetical protein